MGMKVVIIMGSAADQPWADEIATAVKAWGIEVVSHISSAHKVPEHTMGLVQRYQAEQQVIYVTVAGRSNALSGAVAANSVHPVIACPPFKDKADYLTNIHSSLQMPSDVPALTVLEPKNVAAACARIFGLVDAGMRSKVAGCLSEVKASFK
ncbi:MAG: AIR carboxylase family protein [Candidatus Veblenbacteria bacterium]|nr:AIR carboxylase family protein [Candidatus Veblenbacteria bacterium]